MKIVFLDVDGVLNSHRRTKETSMCGIEPGPMRQLNRIVKATDCKIVLSSAWRYVCSGRRPWMTLDGFAYMLHTHGFIGMKSLIGQTERDEVCPECEYRHKMIRGKVECDFVNGNRVCIKCGASSTRGKQIAAWMKHGGKVERCVVLDDDAFDFAECDLPFVQTKADRGLTAHGADKAIKILGREK